MKNNLRFPYVLTEAFLLLVFSVYILFPGVNGYYSILEGKFSCFLLIFGGYLALMILFTLEMMIMGYIKPVSPITLWRRASLTQKAVVFYFLTSLISTFLSPYCSFAWIGMSRYEGMLTIGIYCCCFLCVSVFGANKSRILYVFAGTMAIFCTVCLLQFAGLNPLGLYPPGYDYWGGNIEYSGVYLGTIGNADSVSALLCIAIPFLAWNVSVQKTKKKWFILIPIVLSLVVLFVSDVKGGLVGVFFGSFFSLPIVLPTTKRQRFYAWVAVFSLILLGVIIIKYIPATGTLYEIQQVLQGNWNDRFGSGRIDAWKQILRMIPEHPLCGFGPDTMLAAGVYVSGTPVDIAHNEYINVFFHQGALGLASYLLVLFSLFIRWVKNLSEYSSAVPLGCSALCYCVQAFFGLSICLTSGVFWIVLGLLEKSLPKKRGEY